MPVRIGEAHLPADFKRYKNRFSFLELETEPGKIPSKARLQACAAEAPEGFVFSLVVPSSVASLEAASSDVAWKRAQAVSRLLGAKWWVVRTPAAVRPTSRARAQLGELFERLRSSGQRVAWEPRGIWDDAAAEETAQQLGVHLVQDLARQVPVPGTTLYTRVLALGRGARVGLGLAEVIAERLQAFEEAFVVVEGRGAAELQKAVGVDRGDAELAPEAETPETETPEAETEAALGSEP